MRSFIIGYLVVSATDQAFYLFFLGLIANDNLAPSPNSTIVVVRIFWGLLYVVDQSIAIFGPVVLAFRWVRGNFKRIRHLYL